MALKKNDAIIVVALVACTKFGVKRPKQTKVIERKLKVDDHLCGPNTTQRPDRRCIGNPKRDSLKLPMALYCNLGHNSMG